MSFTTWPVDALECSRDIEDGKYIAHNWRIFGPQIFKIYAAMTRDPIHFEHHKLRLQGIEEEVCLRCIKGGIGYSNGKFDDSQLFQIAVQVGDYVRMVKVDSEGRTVENRKVIPAVEIPKPRTRTSRSAAPVFPEFPKMPEFPQVPGMPSMSSMLDELRRKQAQAQQEQENLSRARQRATRPFTSSAAFNSPYGVGARDVRGKQDSSDSAVGKIVRNFKNLFVKQPGAKDVKGTERGSDSGDHKAQDSGVAGVG